MGLGLPKSGQIGHETSDLVVHFPSLRRRNRIFGNLPGIRLAIELRIFLKTLDPGDLQF